MIDTTSGDVVEHRTDELVRELGRRFATQPHPERDEHLRSGRQPGEVVGGQPDGHILGSAEIAQALVADHEFAEIAEVADVVERGQRSCCVAVGLRQLGAGVGDGTPCERQRGTQLDQSIEVAEVITDHVDVEEVRLETAVQRQHLQHVVADVAGRLGGSFEPVGDVSLAPVEVQ